MAPTKEQIKELYDRCIRDLGTVDVDIGLRHMGEFLEAVLDYIDEKVK